MTEPTGPEIFSKYELTAQYCLATAEDLADAVNRLGMSLSAAARASNIGLLDGILRLDKHAFAAFEESERTQRHQE